MIQLLQGETTTLLDSNGNVLKRIKTISIDEEISIDLFNEEHLE